MTKLLQINTNRFGMIDIEENKIIHMPMGLPGFPGRDRFVLFEKEETRPFCWLQSVDDPGVCLVVMDPFLFMPDYKVDLEHIRNEMGWTNDADRLLIIVVVHVTNDFSRRVLANLNGPIVINTNKLEAIQVVIHNSRYSFEHQVMPFN